MEFKDNFIQGFELSFNSLEEDSDRYLDALIELLDEGKLELVEGRSLFESHYRSMRVDEWIIESYFKGGHLDLLENYLISSCQLFFQTLGENSLQIIFGFAKLGERERILRAYRAHTSWMKSKYWSFLSESERYSSRNSTEEHVPIASLAADQDEWESHMLKMRETFLEVMLVYHDVLKQVGAPIGDLSSLEADMKAIVVERRPSRKGEIDNRAMTEAVFWEIIDSGLETQSLGERLTSMPDRLARFQSTAIRDFDWMLWQMNAQAYRMDIWGIAYLLQDGCSDDAFDEFRGWLILQGKAEFKKTLRKPDRFDVARDTGATDCMGLLRAVAPMAYKLRTGQVMPSTKFPPLELQRADWKEEEFAIRLPAVAKAVGWVN